MRTVEITSSAKLPPLATCLSDSLNNVLDRLLLIDLNTYCMYVEMDLFITPPVMAMQGKIEERARARRHDRM